jgi:hypothetical protein
MGGIEYEDCNGLHRILENCTGFLCFDLVDHINVDTHDILIGKLVDTCVTDGEPMTYKYYHEVIKGKAPKSAPTFLTNK